MPGLKQLHRDRIGAEARKSASVTFHIANDADNQPRIVAGKTVIVGWCDYWPGALGAVQAEFERSAEAFANLARFSQATEVALAERAKAGGAQ